MCDQGDVLLCGNNHHADCQRTMAHSSKMFAIKFLSLLLTILRVNGDCLSGSCQKISLDVRRDAMQDSEFVGHVFHNSVTLNPIQCYTWCIQDCRCLSFNYKKNNEDKRCELNEGNHFTNQSSLKYSSGSTYYNLRREYQAKVNNCSWRKVKQDWCLAIKFISGPVIGVYKKKDIYFYYGFSGTKFRLSIDFQALIFFQFYLT